MVADVIFISADHMGLGQGHNLPVRSSRLCVSDLKLFPSWEGDIGTWDERIPAVGTRV